MGQVSSPWGLLPDGWKLSTIKKEMIVVTDYVANGSFASLAENVQYSNTEEYAILIRLYDYNNNFSGNFVYVNEHAYNFLSKSKLYGDEIIISNVGANVGTVFKCPRLSKPMTLGPNSIVVKLNGNNDFYFYWFKSRYGKYCLDSIVSGSAQPKFNKTHFKELPIPVPPLVEQEKIASLLSSIDDKIAVNSRICANLEAQAEALFKSWFVDFTPFKDQPFVDSELGPIPQGLKICQISDISHTLETGRRQKGGAVSEGIPSVGAEHVKGIGTYDYSKTKYISPEFANKLKTGKINGYELLIYKDGGKPGYFIPNFSIFGEGYPFDLCYLNEHVFKLDFLQNKGYNIFNYFQFKTNYVMSFLNAQGGKAAIPGINKKDIECIYTFAPNNPKVVEFGNFALPLFTKILRNCVENQRLAALRDTLLPKLMSGEIKL